ncbi:MAG: hypothetical protein JW929_15090 [Anaerolineales bacterium]|nr:hypothetical protein [Anaerolineales bacterium]
MGQAFVARHELAHARDAASGNFNCAERESAATRDAAPAYPAGFVETVVSCLWISYQDPPDKHCWLFGSWRIFKFVVLL